jgi:hypothetical protein
VHATRRFMSDMPIDHVVAKLDFTNAFNNIHRDVMLASVADNVPDIYKFCHLAYDQSTHFRFAHHDILSQEGCQQGDPLGHCYFA